MFPCLKNSVTSFLAILITCSLPMLQAEAQDAQLQRTPGALVMGSNMAFAAAFPVVKDEPYTASVLTQYVRFTPDGERIVYEGFNIHMRDSAGRLRDEQLASPPDSKGSYVQATVHVLDPVSMQEFRWNKDTKRAFTGAIPANFSNYRHSPIVNCVQPRAAYRADGLTNDRIRSEESYEDLDERVIEGLNARGCRITRILPVNRVTNESGISTTETWDSPELRINLLTIVHNADGTELLTKLSNIQRREPDPALFHLPE